MRAWTDDPDERFAVGAVLHTASGPDLIVRSSRHSSGRWLVGFAGVDDRTAAEALHGTQLLVPAAARPPIDDPDEFYDIDLIGLAAQTPPGTALGRVTDVVHGPAGDYLAISLDTDGREHLVPFVGAMVPTVDLPGGRVVVDAPEGLFDL